VNFVLNTGEGVLQPLLDKRNGKVGDVNADPLAAELLRRMNRCPAATEWI
jgi:hypothetical protein